MTLTPEETKTVRVALWAWADYARARANEIAQDRQNRLGLSASAVGAALDAAKRAEDLIAKFQP